MGGVKKLFGAGKPKMPPPPPPPPMIEDAMEAQAKQDATRRRRGAAATILTGPSGVGSAPVGTKTLLGS
jgi:hypothetical protein